MGMERRVQALGEELPATAEAGGQQFQAFIARAVVAQEVIDHRDVPVLALQYPVLQEGGEERQVATVA